MLSYISHANASAINRCGSRAVTRMLLCKPRINHPFFRFSKSIYFRLLGSGEVKRRRGRERDRERDELDVQQPCNKKLIFCWPYLCSYSILGAVNINLKHRLNRAQSSIHNSKKISFQGICPLKHRKFLCLEI